MEEGETGKTDKEFSYKLRHRAESAVLCGVSGWAGIECSSSILVQRRSRCVLRWPRCHVTS